MINKNSLLTTVLAMVLGLIGLSMSACSYVSDSSADGENNAQNDACRQMKRQMTFNARTNTIDSRYVAPSQREALAERYEEYGCR